MFKKEILSLYHTSPSKQDHPRRCPREKPGRHFPMTHCIPHISSACHQVLLGISATWVSLSWARQAYTASSLVSQLPSCHPPFHPPHGNQFPSKPRPRGHLPLCSQSSVASHHTQNRVRVITLCHRLFPMDLFVHEAGVL